MSTIKPRHEASAVPVFTTPTRSSASNPAKATLELDENLSYRQSMLNFALGKEMSELYRVEGLTTQHWKVISVVCHHAPMRAKDIEPLVTLDKTALSRNLRALVALGLVVRRVSSEDARAVEIQPTSKGRRLHLRVAQRVMKLQSELLHGLPAGHVEVFFLVMQHFQDRLAARRRQSGK